MQLTPRSTQQTLSDGQSDSGTGAGMYSAVHGFGLWNFQTVGWKRVINAVTVSCFAYYLSPPPQVQLTLTH